MVELGNILRQRKDRFSEDEARTLLFGAGTEKSSSLTIKTTRLQRLWYLSMAFYMGHQTKMDLGSVALMTDWLEPSNDEIQYVANHIAPLVARQVSRMMKSQGVYRAVPATNDFRDQRGAKAATHMLSYWHEYLNMRDLRRTLATWMVLAGTGFLYVDWDDKTGKRKRIYRDPFDESNVIDGDALPASQRQMLDDFGMGEDTFEGDMYAAALSPFEVVVPTSFVDLDEMPWIRIDRVRSFEWLYDHYERKANEVRPENHATPNHLSFIRRLIGMSSGQIHQNDGSNDNAVMVTEFWRPPCKLMPKGAKIVGAGGVILENTNHPSFERGLDIRFPIARARFLTVPFSFWGMSMVQSLIDPQIEYNRSRTQIIRHRDVLSQPQWMASRRPTWMRNEVGDFWIYEDGHRPELVQPPSLSQTHIETKQAALYDMQIVSAQSEASQGQNPSGVRSGNALLALQERDLETIGTTFEEMESCLEEASSMILKVSSKMLNLPRAVAIHGKAFMADVIELTGSDLRGNTKVILERGSTLPQSEAAAIDLVQAMLTAGVLNPMQDPDHRRFVYKTLKWRDLESSMLMEDLQERRAEQENEMFLNPQMDPVTGGKAPWPDVAKFDDDIIHIRVHTKCQLTDEWELLPVDQKLAHMAHIFKHEQKLAQLAMLQQQAAMQVKPQGSPPKELGRPSPPAKKETV